MSDKSSHHRIKQKQNKTNKKPGYRATKDIINNNKDNTATNIPPC